MERLKQMKEQLVSCVQGQMANLAQADTHEMGAAIDMIKDLEQAMYYCSITKAMKEREDDEKKCHLHDKEYHYYTEKYLPYEEDYRDMDRERGRMYYPHGETGRGELDGRSRHGEVWRRGRYREEDGRDMRESYDREYPMEMRDHREGHSPIQRKYYMEAKELKHDKKAQMQELEKYMHELSKDITEMISDASPEETTLLKQKLVTLIEKIK